MSQLEEKEISILDLPTEDLAAARREAAFSNSYIWEGKPFEGLTSARKDLWSSLCHKAGFPPLSQCFDEISLFAPLAKAMLFVLITPKSKLKLLRAQGMDKMLDAFDDWCDVAVPIHLEPDVISLGIKLLNDSTASQTEVVPSEGSSVGKP
jgi:hypothetical protein